MTRTLMTGLSRLFQTRSWDPNKKSHRRRHYCILDNCGWYSYYIDNGMLCILIGIASMRRFQLEHTTYHHIKGNREGIPMMPSELALWLTLISSNYPCLQHIFMIPKVLEPLKFYPACTLNKCQTSGAVFPSRHKGACVRARYYITI